MSERIYRTKKLERWSFALFMAGQGIINTFVGSYFQLYLTNLGIAATAVGLLFLVSRVWDAVNDPLFGAILDKTNSKKGRFLPFLRASNVILPIATVLLFAIPNEIPVVWKLVWAFVAYLFYDVAYTICDVPIFAMTSAATDQVHERVDIMSRNTVLAAVAMLAIMVVVPQVYESAGPLACAGVVAVVAAILMFFMSKNAKERFVNKDEEEVGLKQMVQYVKENKYLRYGFLGIMILSMTNMINAVLNYFAIHCLGSLEQASIISVIVTVPSLIIALFMPALTKKIDKFVLLMIGVAGQTIASIISFFVGYEDNTMFLIFMLLRGIFYGVQLVLQLQLTGDFVEYGEFITGKRLQGTAYSIQTFVFKIMNAIPGSLALFILGLFGFVSGEGAVQPESAINAIWVLFTLSPVAGAILSIPFFAKYKLRDKTVQIMAAANSGEMPREEAEKLLEGKI